MVCGCKSGCTEKTTEQYVSTGSLVTDQYTPQYGYYGDCYSQPWMLSQTQPVSNTTTLLQVEEKIKIAPIVILSVAILGLGFLLTRGKR